MALDLSRLRRGEWIAGGSALLLLAIVFVLKWYGLKGGLAPAASQLGVATSVNGWNGLTHLRWLMLLTIAASLGLAYLQAARRAPALPVAMSVIVTTLALLTVLGLIYRVLINEPGPDSVVDQKLGAYVGLACAIGILYGAFASTREEGIAQRDAVPVEEVVRVGPGGLT
jgi:hypothetical protein